MNRNKLLIISLLFMITLLPVAVAQEKSTPANPPEELTLDNCLDLATKNSPDLKAAAKSVLIAQTMVEEVQGGFWPKFDYAVFANQAERSIYPYPAQMAIDPIYEYLYGSKYSPLASKEMSGFNLSLTQPLYLGGKLTAGLKLAQAQLNIARENEAKAKQQLTFQVKQAFYQAWLAEQMLKVAQASLDDLEQHVLTVTNYFEVGTVSKYELLRARVQRDSLKPQVIAAQNGVKLAKLNLATIIGLSQDEPYLITYDVRKLQVPEKIQLELKQVLEVAYRNRPEIHQIEQAREISQLQLNLAEAGYKPTMALVGQYTGASMNYDPYDWTENKYWSLTLSISGNFFSGFSTAAKVKGSKENIELTDIKETKLRDMIRLDVEQSVHSLTESLETIRANKSNIDLAKETLELTQARFEEGMATTMDVMDSQLAVDQALNGYYRGVALYLTAEAKVDLATGGR